MIVFPNAKINLGLSVTEKRSDGYHNIETLFVPVKGLQDVLEVLVNKDSNDDLFNLTGVSLEGNAEENIVLKALTLLRNERSIPPLKIHLHKIIPAGAGLGGGSSNGAFMLNLINDLFELQMSNQELEEKAQKLGADCTFFIRNESSLATGIGDQLTSFNLNLENHWLMVVVPPVHISTPEAYRKMTPAKPEISLKDSLMSDINEWCHSIKNDFENYVFRQYPHLIEVKKTLYEKGAQYASLSGSGSAFFGIFEEEPHIQWPKEHFTWMGRMFSKP